MAQIILGTEDDDALIAAVHEALRALGGRKVKAWWGVGGSQEVAHEKWRIGWRTVVLEGETYVGLSLTGSQRLTARIADLADHYLSGES